MRGTAGKLLSQQQVGTADYAFCTQHMELEHQHKGMALAGLTVLVDPWLEGDLTFGEQAWLYTGKKGRLADIALNLKDIEAQTDVILLSQVSRAAARSHAVQGLHQTQTCQCCLAGLPVKGLGRPLQVHAELRLPGHQHHRGHFLVQGLDDHAHKPTLRKLSKDTPVVGSPAAAAVARQLGFKTVRHCSWYWSLSRA